MGKRDLLFLTLCIVGLAAISRTLLSDQRQGLFRGHDRAERQASREPGASPSSLQTVVEDVDQEFRDAWSRSSADRGAALTPAPEAPLELRIRRASLALMGSIPSLEELRWLENLDEPARFAAWVEHLLADKRTANHVAERLTRAFVGTENGPFLLYRRSRFHEWLAEQFAANRPYDEIVRELISGNGLWTTSPSVNFLTATLDANNDNQPDPVRLAGRTSRAFLGMRIDCLQCHDDKLGNVELGESASPRFGTQRDFHQLAAFFCEANVSVLGIRDRENKYEVEYLGSTEPEETDALPPFLARIRQQEGPLRQQLAAWVTDEANRPFARTAVNRMWALVYGRPLVEPIDDIPLHAPAGGYPPGLERLADDFIESGFDMQRLIRVLLSVRPFQLDSRAPELTTEHFDRWAAFPLTRMRPEQVAASLLQSCSLKALDDQRHVIVQLQKFGGTNDFVRRYGDTGEDEFKEQPGTLPQRLMMMNGELILERTAGDTLLGSPARIARMAATDEQAVEIAYLCVLTRRPSQRELDHFVEGIKNNDNRHESLTDLFWVLLNSTEFNWSH
ncbi:MAG: DUF1553 domain-containing protein [Planctomycetales bacterium]|nr:DUF1553 domain-containing protein [Planctomycetales bacterium]